LGDGKAQEILIALFAGESTTFLEAIRSIL